MNRSKSYPHILSTPLILSSLILGLLILGMGATAPSLMAQEATLEEVVVTAQRRAENLQNIPLSVTALSAVELERRQIHSVLDLQSAVPNIAISRNTGTANGARVFLRGVGEDDSRATVEQAISIYIDGVYVGPQIGALLDLFDVEQIEVLRGPQGTLYGRNANGGAIRITTQKPEMADNSFQIKSTLGNENRIDTQLSANLSNSENLALNFALLSRTRDGLFQTDPAGGISADEIGKWENLAMRGALRWRSREDLEATLRYDASFNKTDPTPANTVVGDNDIFTLQAVGTGPKPGPHYSDRYNSDIETQGISLTIEKELDGALKLKSITARRSMEDELNTVIGGNYDQHTDQSQLSQEFQLSSDWDGPLNFVSGLFWFDENIDFDFTRQQPYDIRIDTRAWALFGQGTFDIDERTRLTAGLRYTDEEKTFRGQGPDPDFMRASAGETIQTDDPRDWQNLSFKLALNYQLHRDVMSYASYATGFRSGSWSPDNFQRVEDETVSTFEVGLRSDLLENRLRLNATWFFSTYEDLQLSGTVDGIFTRFDVPEAEISGLEIEANALLAPGLTASLAAAWLDAEYTDMNLSAAQGISNLTVNGVVNAKFVAQAVKENPNLLPSTATYAFLEAKHSSILTGVEDQFRSSFEDMAPSDIISRAKNHDLKNAPEFSWKLALSYNRPLTNGMELELNGEFIYEDESYNVTDNVESIRRQETNLINLRAAVSTEQWEVALWAKNLSDEIYYPAGIPEIPLFALPTVYVADPRTYGLDFKWLFSR